MWTVSPLPKIFVGGPLEYQLPPSLPLSTERGTTFSPTFRNERSESATNFCIRDFLSVLCTHLLQNVIQENIEIIYFDWCMITITKNFVVYIFSSCMQASLYFEECEFSVKLFLMNWNKSVLILKLILSVSHNLDFFNWSKQCLTVLHLVSILYKTLLLQGLLKVTTSLEYVWKCYVQCIYIKKEKIKPFLTGYFFITLYAI